MQVTERFLKYIAFDTTSDENSPTCPSTQKQMLLGRALVEEMLEMGIQDAHMDDNGYVYGTVPGTGPVIGLIAHMDTSSACSGHPVKANTVYFDGTDILLNKEKQIYLKQQDFPNLARHKGKHLIVTDGTTLLGADDKAGIAEIMTVAETLLHSDVPHATLKIGFTPDEEIGRGADRFDLNAFGADYGYTIDGGMLGEMEFENFNAASAVVTVVGRSVHPGSAKGLMVNAQNIAMEFHSLLPYEQRPEYTENYEGFFFLSEMHGQVEEATLQYIIRDHDMAKFQQKKALFENACHFLNQKYGPDTVCVKVTDSYFNMKEKILPVYHIIEAAQKAMEQVGITPTIIPIRGGTDGARLSYEGLPCPNLFTGGDNFHGRFEYIPVEDMEAAVAFQVKLLQNAVNP